MAVFSAVGTAKAQPITVAPFFNSGSMTVGGTDTLNIFIDNSLPSPTQTNLAFTVTLPSGLVVGPGGASGTCGGASISAVAGATSFSLSGATLLTGTNCQPTVSIKGNVAGNYTVTVPVTTDQTSSSGSANETVNPAVLPPTVSKAFGVGTLAVGGTTSLSFTINNPNAGASVTNVAFTDTLPAGMVVATPNGLTGSCGGGTITATAGGGTVNLSTATIAASNSCTFSVNVTVSTAGTMVNSVTVNSDQGTGNTATASLNVLAVSSTAVVSSLNPSALGQAVTFTATVTGAPGTPTGTVDFKDGATTLVAGVALVAGSASFTTSALTKGAHTISAVYSGDGTHSTSTGTVQQTVGIPIDSVKLRQMQNVGTNLVAQSSGQAISGAISSAINDGFNDNPALMTPSDSGLHFTFTAEPAAQRGVAAQQDGVRDFTADPLRRHSRVDDGFSALGYAPAITKAPPAKTNPRVWTAWLDLRGVLWNRDTFGSDIKGDQFNALAGVSARLTPDFLIGVLGGYETFDFTSQVLAGRLKGGGWTAGTYVGWKFAPHLRLDAGFAGSLLDYQGSAGTASGNFSGNRWLASGGVTGSYDLAALVLEPSARIYALWEHENAYTDSLGTLQATRNFSTGRTSGGLKVSLPIAWSSMAVVTPYAGLYGDYYFSKDDDAVAAVTPIPLIQGWSARAVSGVGVTLNGKAQLSIGGELGGLGSDYTMWLVRGRASVPF
jgi:hypothetical protein